LFTGIVVNAAAVPKLMDRVDALRAAHPDLRWSDRGGWHVTLQFYGMVDAAREACLREQLLGVDGGCVEVVLRGMGTFERAGVLWAGVDLTEDLEELQRRVVAVGEECGFAREERPYRPHLTVARRNGRGGRWAFKKGWEMDSGLEFGAFRARELVLYESVAGPGGSRYEVLERYALRG
jgi:2'-5' RNA ligase